jgi:hypothetical protein
VTADRRPSVRGSAEAGTDAPAGSAGSPGSAASLVPVVVRAVGLRPWLWITALGTIWRLAQPGWWRRPPYLPLPDDRLWSFRMVTAYGRPDARPDGEDIVAYLEWCKNSKRQRERVRRT